MIQIYLTESDTSFNHKKALNSIVSLIFYVLVDNYSAGVSRNDVRDN